MNAPTTIVRDPLHALRTFARRTMLETDHRARRQAALRTAVELFEARFGALYVAREGGLHLDIEESTGDLGSWPPATQTESLLKNAATYQRVEVDEHTLVAPFLFEGRLLGAMALDRPEAEFASSDLELANVLAEQFALLFMVERQESERDAARRRTELQVKVDALRRLSGHMAHGVNNSLTAIRGYTDLLLLGDRSTERADIEEIRMAVERAMVLTQLLSDFARLPTRFETTVEPSAVVRELDGLLRRLVGPAIKVEIELAGEVGPVRGDAGIWHEILTNLASNARDAMPHGGRLRIELRRQESDPARYVVLTVRDTGFGMDEETKRCLFEPLSSFKRSGSHAGLGLATIYTLVERAGGHLRCISEPHRGTTFELHFPVSQDPFEHHPSVPAETREAVLVVDDEEFVRDLVVRILAQGGYRVFAASSGTEALGMAGAMQATLLVTDVVMPGMSGCELAKRLLEKQPELRVLFMSGYNDFLGLELLNQKAEFLSKPFRPTHLLQTVRQICDRVRAGSTTDLSRAEQHG